MTPSAILIAAKALIPTEAEWERVAPDGEGWEFDGERDVVVARCAGVAICDAGPVGLRVDTDPSFRAQIYMHRAIFGQQGRVARGGPINDIARWNDALGRTLAEVHAAFDLAADMALTNGE